MRVYLIMIRDVPGRSDTKPFGITTGHEGEQKHGYAGFYSVKIARLFCKLLQLDGYEPVEICNIPVDNLILYDRVVFFETENNIYGIFKGRFEPLFKKAVRVETILEHYGMWLY